MIAEITSFTDFQSALAESNNKLVVIDCWATWCGPCKTIAPVYNGLANKTPEVSFYKLDVDAVQDVAEKLSVRSMPTFYFLKNGEKVTEVIGVKPDVLKKAVAQHK